MTILPPWLVHTYKTLLIIGAVACWGFTFRYVTKFKMTTDIGRHLVAMSTVVGAFLTYSAIATIWPGVPGRVWIRTVLFIALVVTLVWRWVMFERLLRKIDKENRDDAVG
jgi:hypothetical protein